MRCAHFDSGRCGSCTLMNVPYPVQLQHAETAVRATLAPHVPEAAWLPTAAGQESCFRNKAKLVVAGTPEAPTFGILDAATGAGVDLRDCGLYETALAAGLVDLTAAVAQMGLRPYDVARRTGELKHLIVTASPDGELMARFVLRSPGQVPRIRRHLPVLLESVPGLRVVSVNLQPEHKAVLEGAEEVVLTEAASLPMRLARMTLHLRPRSFFQTNTDVAGLLYAQAAEWVGQLDPDSVLDLYCGVGGFALAAAQAPRRSPSSRRVEGVEISAEAVKSARRSAAEAGVVADFRAGDATAVTGAGHDLVIVNPPRRGLGADLAATLGQAGPPHLIYSSCNASTLAADLGRLPGYEVVGARLFAMFPQTRHHEVAVLLRSRRSAPHDPSGGRPRR